MKKSLPIFLFLAITLSACGGNTPAELSVDDQVATAVAATAIAEANFENAVAEAVQATVVAMPPTPTAQPAPDAYELSEEELAALIDEAVEEAVLASEASSQATTQSTSDGTLSEDELYEMAEYVYAAEAAIYYADDLIAAYYDLYGAYADDIVYLLTLMEEDLDELIYILEETEALLSTGLDAAMAGMEQLNEAALNLSVHIADSQADREQFLSQVQTKLQEREDKFANISPTEIASGLPDTITQLHDYVEAIKTSFADRKIDLNEMTQIAQLGANAQASIRANGSSQLEHFGGQIDGLTRQISRGEWSAANRNLGGFEASLPERPGRR